MNLNDGEKIQIVEIEPINFKLKSSDEQAIILENYKNFLMTINFDIQIVVISKRAEASKHLNEIQKNIKDNEKLKMIARDYIDLIKEISAVRGSISRKFYIIINYDNYIEEKIQMITEGLNRCGNNVKVCCKEDIKLILHSYLNRRILNIGG
jgi:hypothetical protein